MTEPTQEQYANFGEAVAGILDGYLFDTEGWTEEEKNHAFIEGTILAARVFQIEPMENPAS